MDHQADAQRTDLMTITRFVLSEQSKYPESRGDFTILLSHIVLGCKFVCSSVNKVLLSVTSTTSFSETQDRGKKITPHIFLQFV